MLQIGRRVYYTKDTGNVLLFTAERSVDVRERTVEEDITTFSQLQGVGANLDYIQLAYGECANEFANLGSLHVVPLTKVLTIYPRLIISTDKTQITANGTDTAIITVTVQDTANPQAINFTVNSGVPVTINTSNGVATFGLTTTLTGDYVVTASSNLYGTNSITVKGV